MKKNDSNTTELLEQVRAGDADARNRLVEQSLPPLLRYAQGRLPACVRGVTDTRDLVHDVVVRVLPKLDSFRPTGPGALQAFLRRAVANQIVDEVRRARRRPVSDTPLEWLRDDSPGALADLIARQKRDIVRAALATLSPSDRALIVERFDSQRQYAEVARVLNKPNANAARVAVERAVRRLANALKKRDATAIKVH
jgi:RNA polymerase sigma factor (sigma-70 family)